MVLFQELLKALIAPELHELKLSLIPHIHGAGAHERILHAKSTMNTRAVQADENTVVQRHPLRIRLPTVKAFAVLVDLHQLLKSLLFGFL